MFAQTGARITPGLKCRNCDSPDDFGTRMNIRVFPVFLQDGRCDCSDFNFARLLEDVAMINFGREFPLMPGAFWVWPCGPDLRHKESSSEEVYFEVGPRHHRVARLLDQLPDPPHVDAHQVAAPLPHLPGNEDCFQCGSDSSGSRSCRRRPRHRNCLRIRLHSERTNAR